MKHYASESGHYYEYWHEGHRPYCSPTDSGTEFVFRVLVGREGGTVAVFLSAGVLSAWEQNHGREFSAAERYAIAKMALFQAFDECPVRAKMVDAVRVSAADLNAIVAKLNIE